MLTEQYNVNADTVCRAAECKKGHACLWGKTEDLCRLYCLSLDRFCCLRGSCNSNCAYCTLLDRQSLCGCPVRVELYKKYGL